MMDRRDFVKGATLGVAGLAFASGRGLARGRGPGPLPEQNALPNFLFITSDDHSAADLGCYGNRVIRTPNLDRLAREGMRFEYAYATSPQCSPSRSSILTGRSPHSTGTARLHSPLRSYHRTILEDLKAAGYYTGKFLKVHLGEQFGKRWDFIGQGRAFESFFEARPKERPFYLHVGFNDPHRPYWPGAFSPSHQAAEVIVPDFLPDTPAVRKDLAGYYDEVARMDQRVGELLKLLEKYGVAENTLVIFAGDNGMPFPGAKAALYEPGIHVPLIARWPPRIKPGQVSRDLVSLIDLPPTWLEAAGLPVPEIMEGFSLLGVLEGKGSHVREAIFAERNWHDNLDLIRGLRTRRYKLIHNYLPELPYRPTRDLKRSPTWQSILRLENAKKLSRRHRQRYFALPRPEVELYDLEQDPGETRNLAANPSLADTLRRLQMMLGDWMNRTNDFLPPPFAAPEEEIPSDEAGIEP